MMTSRDLGRNRFVTLGVRYDHASAFGSDVTWRGGGGVSAGIEGSDFKNSC